MQSLEVSAESNIFKKSPKSHKTVNEPACFGYLYLSSQSFLDFDNMLANHCPNSSNTLWLRVILKNHNDLETNQLLEKRITELREGDGISLDIDGYWLNAINVIDGNALSRNKVFDVMSN